MARLSIRHETVYTYERPVGFAPHRLLVRPRDSHAIRVVDATLTVSPPGEAAPILGAIYGDGGQARMDVRVDVRPEGPRLEAA